MTDAERLRRALLDSTVAKAWSRRDVTAVCRAIVEEFGLKRGFVGVPECLILSTAILDVAEGDDE